MSSIPQQRREAAELRRVGKITAAAKTLMGAGLPLEAATIFAEERRYEEALAALLFASPSRTLDDLSPDLLLRAADWLESLKRFSEAARAYRLLGDDARAMALESRSAPPPISVAPPIRRNPGFHARPSRVDMRSEPDIEPERISSVPPVERVSSLPVERVSSLPSSLPVERVSARPASPASSSPPARPASSPPSRRAETVPARLSSVPPPNRSDASSQKLEAATAAEKSGDLVRAADLYLAANAPIGAVRCFMSMNELPRALAAVVRVPRADAQYRRAVALGVDLATRIGELDFTFDQFSAPFFESEPRDEDEINAFFRMGLLLERFDHLDAARAVLGRVLAVRNAAPIRERLAELDKRAAEARAKFARVMEEEERRSAPPPTPKAADEETFPSLPAIQLPPRSRRPTLSESPRAASPPPWKAAERAAEAGALAGAPAPPGKRIDSPIVNVFNIAEGITVARRYKIVRLLGKGGMGAVYEAVDLELDETLAIKLFAHGRDDAALISRFKQELSLARQISHPNVIRLYDFGQQGAIPFITMELLSGIDLAEAMDQGRDLVRDLGWLIQACRGLQCVHERGVVHRDLKPENLFVTTDGVVKLMDFGIAKRSSTPANLTQQGFTAGTPAYMAPEQAENFASATHLADIYSVGIIAYRMFTGVLPFENENPMAVLIKHIQEIPVPPRDHNSSIPDELEYIILQLLEKKPELRVQSCAELADDLEQLKTRLEARPSRRPR